MPVLGFCAHSSGIGKTTLLTQLIPALIQKDLRISVVKHAHHEFDIDHEGKDSFKLRQAGAVQMMVASRQRWALMTELVRTLHTENEPNLVHLLAQMDCTLTDLVLAEGFKHEAIPKIEVHRAAFGSPLLASEDANIIAIATDTPLSIATPQIDLNDINSIAAFIHTWLKK
ncbi:MAG: molybdopterin-guanine dinucleotide biosynthesis protein B [Burkholderiaceae bacterium]|nr:molybdopterin-guanine dinucleotide biosynthesis protein B [Burkholderiaceae bacterium]